MLQNSVTGHNRCNTVHESPSNLFHMPIAPHHRSLWTSIEVVKIDKCLRRERKSTGTSWENQSQQLMVSGLSSKGTTGAGEATSWSLGSLHVVEQVRPSTLGPNNSQRHPGSIQVIARKGELLELQINGQVVECQAKQKPLSVS